MLLASDTSLLSNERAESREGQYLVDTKSTLKLNKERDKKYSRSLYLSSKGLIICCFLIERIMKRREAFYLKY